MSPQLDSTTGTTENSNVKCDIPAIQTCNCCLQVIDFSTWNHAKFTESDSWNEVATRTNNLNVMSCLFHVSPLAPPSPQRPSCHIGPVSGVPDLCYPSPRQRRRRPAAPRPPPGGLPEPQSPAARGLGPESSAADGDGTRQVT